MHCSYCLDFAVGERQHHHLFQLMELRVQEFGMSFVQFEIIIPAPIFMAFTGVKGSKSHAGTSAVLSKHAARPLVRLWMPCSRSHQLKASNQFRELGAFSSEGIFFSDATGSFKSEVAPCVSETPRTGTCVHTFFYGTAG